MLVSERLNSLTDVSVEIKDMIPRYCTSCDNELDLNMSLSKLSCPNPVCVSKLTHRAVYLCKYFGIDNFGESFFDKFFRITGEIYVSNILCLSEESIEDYLEDYEYVEDEDYGISYESFSKSLYKLYEKVQKIREKLTTTDYLKALALPDIQSRADDLVKGYLNFQDLYDDLSSCSTTSDFARIFGISEGASKLMILIAKSLATYRSDVLNFESKFDFFVPVDSDVELKIVCSTAVGKPFKSKQEFYRYIDNNYANKVKVTWSSSATKSCDLLIWSGADGSDVLTSKVEKICKFNSTGSHIPILTAQQFLNILDACSDGYTLQDTLESLDIIDYRE